MNEQTVDRLPLDSQIQRIATGPKLSKDLGRDQARAGMRGVLEGSVHPVQAAIFLIAALLPVTPFLPAVLAACGLPAVSHGTDCLAPKYGLTHAQVLQAAGVPIDLSPAAAAKRLINPANGWAYVDQSRYASQLRRLRD